MSHFKPNKSCQKTTKLAGWKKVWGQGQGHCGHNFSVYAKVWSKGIYVLHIFNVSKKQELLYLQWTVITIDVQNVCFDICQYNLWWYASLLFFSSPDDVQESLCCHPVVGVGVGVCVSTYKLIDYNSYTHLVTPLIFSTHMPCDKTFQCMSKFWPVTLTFTAESVFRFQILRLGFENCS